MRTATASGVLDWPSVAIYHFNAQIVSRSTGASAVAGAAYRSGERLTDERTGQQHDYRGRDDLDGAEILTPRDSPAWAQDRAQLWNAVEAAERRKDAQVAREVRVAIPRELRPDDGRALVRDYAQRAFVDRGMVADLAHHGGQGENPHAHIMLTTRSISPEGFGPKNRDWNTKAQLATWREDWAASANRALERRGHAERIDHRTLAAQRDEALQRGDTARAETLDRDPEIHLGRASWMALRTGEVNERTERNDRIADGNRDREQERVAGHEDIRTIQEQIRDLIRHVAEKVKEKVKGLVRGEDRGPQPQPDHEFGPSR